MADLKEEPQAFEMITPVSRYQNRLFSQVPIPPSGLMLRQFYEDPTGNFATRKRRAASEQVNRRDR